MEARYLFVYVASTMWVLEPAHGKFTDFLGHLPKKMGEAFKTTWTGLRINLKANIKPKRIRRMGVFRAVTPIVLLKDYTAMGGHIKQMIPVLPTPNSRYRYLWRSTMEQAGSVENNREPIKLPSNENSVLPLLLHTTEKPMNGIKTKFNAFRIRVSYKWQLKLS